MSAEHMPGLLEYGECSDGEWWIAQVGSTEQIAYTVPIEHGDARDVARRMVACWHVCDGMSTQSLELMPGNFFKPQYERVRDLEAQRGELLAALQTIVDEVDGTSKPYSSDSYLPPHFIYATRAAIAKVEGGAK